MNINFQNIDQYEIHQETIDGTGKGGKNKRLEENLPPEHSKKIIVPSAPVAPVENVEWMRANLQYWCNSKCLELVVDSFKPVPGRRFRSDFMITGIKLLIEYDGLAYGKTGHTSSAGFTKDTEKHNLSTLEGYTVLRYTYKNYRNVIDHVERFYNLKMNYGK